MVVDSELKKQQMRDKLRQLLNMSATITKHTLDFLPEAAADVLGDVADSVASENPAADNFGTDNDIEDAGEPDDTLVSDFGFELEPSTEVFDADGGFSYGSNDDYDYSFIGGGIFEDDVIGMFDIGNEQLKMNGLKPVTLSIARSLVTHGLDVITIAIAQADAQGLPGPTTRKNCQAHLQWHKNKLAGLSGPPDSTMYDSADDLKKWTMEALIEANAVEEGAQFIADAWSVMWAEISAGLQRVPAMILKLPGKALEAVTGIPWWGWYAGGAVVAGGLLYGAYKIITSEGGGRIIGTYLGGRR